jgi:hydrogenase nickel incorporation protein HypB
VGNLVCPASWDLGENAKVVVLSVTEGEDKPLKYPKMFEQARHAVLNKIDLLPYVPFDVEKAIGFMRQVNPALEIFQVSALSGEGMGSWYDFLRRTAAAGVAAAGTNTS